MENSGIVVTGTGEGRFAPDAVSVSIGVSAARTSMGQARTEAGAAADRLVSALESAGVAPADIQTDHLAVDPEWDHSGRVARRTGYRVTSTYSVRLRDIHRATDTLDRAMSAAGNDAVLHHLSFVLDHTPERQAEVRALAWADAEAKARQIASLAGVSLGAAAAVEEIDAAEMGPMARPMFARAAGAEAMPAIAQGEATMAIRLRVQFTIG